MKNKTTLNLMFLTVFMAIFYSYFTLAQTNSTIGNNHLLSEQESEKVISVILGERYKIDKTKQISGFKQKVIESESIINQVDELPLDAVLSSGNWYHVHGYRYLLTENNLINSKCDNKVGYLCKRDELRYVRLNKGKVNKIKIHGIAIDFVEIAGDINNTLSELLMEIASVPYAELFELEKQKNSPEGNDEFIHDYVKSILTSDKKIIFKPKIIYPYHKYDENNIMSLQYHIAYCGWINNSCVYNFEALISNLTNKDSEYKVEFFPGPIA